MAYTQYQLTLRTGTLIQHPQKTQYLPFYAGIVNHLWKLGVLPFSRHTGNLDYEKYVEGLLGY